ncbi:putative ATP-dependent endonuclease of the OLDfamily YbjD subgroup [Salmonella enterica subsp. enterica]|nr:putative ATP-dependent endonuclease of the OLDfamily YbjD subgroup [Salmonella enterica subsp. enterica]
MILERVEIVGFRGINRLSLMLEQNNVLIGGKRLGQIQPAGCADSVIVARTRSLPFCP